MQEIKCPKCGEVFQVDESGYAAIVKQVRDREFEKELLEREQAHKAEKDSAVRLAVSRIESEKDKEISELRAMIKTSDAENRLELDKVASEKDRLLAEKELEIVRLQGELEMKKTSTELAVENAVREKETRILELKSRMELQNSEWELKERSLCEKHADEIRRREEEIAYYKDFKARQSTKMVGESLEQHCRTEFNKLRATAFKNSYFEKDNDVRTGSKGDYIYRESSEDGTEFVSIMFEMKNEMDTTATKHKNEDFFKELDKDRKEKNCEYAVLVSLLESESELYNAGIVDVSYKFDKMYVVRPQCFIPIITLLRNAAFTALEYKQELQLVRNQDIDISNFEDSLMKFKNDFSRNYEIAHNHFDKAIDEIDKTIQHLEKVKKELLGSDNQLRIANSKVDDVSVKKLTRGNPTMKAKFEEAKGVL